MALPSKHGDARHYWRGCRCKACKRANADYTTLIRRRLGKAYVRAVNLRCAHGLSLAEYNGKLKQQRFKCAVCRRRETGRNQHGVLPLAVDHNHRTGAIRGLLCMRCNRALGLLRDSKRIVARLLAYRRRY